MLDYRQLNAVAELIQRGVQASDALQHYALGLWRATAAPAEYGVRLSDLDTAQLMLAGASPRGMSLLLRAARVAAWLDGRGYVTPEDVQAVFVESHRAPAVLPAGVRDAPPRDLGPADERHSGQRGRAMSAALGRCRRGSV